MMISITCLVLIFMTSNCEIIDNVGISILKKLNINHCIVVDEDFKFLTYNSQDVKLYTKRNVFTKFMNIKSFANYLVKGKYANFKTGVVIKTNKMADIFTRYINEGPSEKMLPAFTWIMFDDESNTLIHRMDEFYIPYNCQFLLINKINNSYYEINEIYNIRNNLQRFRTRVGFWSGNMGLAMSYENFYQRRFNMFGTKITWGYGFKPYCTFKEDCKHAEMILSFAKLMNFTADLQWIPDYDNVTMELYRTIEGDVRGLGIVSENPVNDFLGPTLGFKSYIHIKNEGDKHGISAFIAPFSGPLWRRTLLYLLLSAFCMVLIEYWVSINRQLNNLLTYAFVPFDIIFNQFGSTLQNNFSTRLALLAIRTTAFIIVPAYSAAIISYLTISNPKLPFTDLVTFAEDGTYKISGLTYSYNQYYFSIPTDPHAIIIKEKNLVIDAPHSFQAALKLMCSTKYALVEYDNGVFSKKNLPHPCKIIKVPKPIFPINSGMFLRPNSPFTNIFRKNLIYLFEIGMMKRFMAVHEDGIMNEEKENFTPIDLPQVLPLIVLLFCLKAISFIIFLGELACKTERKVLYTEPGSLKD